MEAAKTLRPTHGPCPPLRPTRRLLPIDLEVPVQCLDLWQSRKSGVGSELAGGTFKATEHDFLAVERQKAPKMKRGMT